MGGFGSGRWDRYGKAKVEALQQIRVEQMHRDYKKHHPRPAPGTRPTRVKITWEDGTGEHVQEIRIFWTGCHFGGLRPWYVCPSCGRHCRVLYHYGRFRCRRCYRVVYAVQSESALDRARRRIEKLEARLVEDYNRPRYMHRSTYARILEALDRAIERENAALGEDIARYNRLVNKH